MKFLAVILLFIKVSFADEPYKVIGRGVVDKRTGERLQIACVGESLPDSSERSCDRLQFLYTDEIGSDSKLVGPVLTIKGDAKIKTQLKGFLKKNGLMSDLTKNRKFAMTRKIFNQENSRPWQTSDALLLTGFGYGMLKLVGPALTTAPQAFGVLLVAGLSAPVVVDVVFFPIAAILDAKEKNAIYGFNRKSTEAMQDNARYSWQFRPKKIRTAVFESLKEKLNVNEKEQGK